MTTQDGLWAAAIAAGALMVIAAVADWRRGRRTNLDDIGWMPWRGVQVFGLFAAVLFVTLALRI